MPWEQLVSELADERNYEVQVESQAYQVVVNLLENTDTYVCVMAGVDDKHSTPAPPRPPR